jgi:hypothetical protein
MAEIGAFCFGLVLGWFTYFTNRYRSGDIGLGDLTKLIAVLGGGAITALFGEAKTALFGFYGLGLAIGFFAYFLVLVWMVAHSDGAFTWSWFLDGRRKKPADDETTEGAESTRFPMSLRPTEEESAVPRSPVPAAVAPFAEVTTLRDQAIEDTFQALRDLAGRIAGAPDGAARVTLLQAQAELTERQNALLAVRLREVLDSDAVRTALDQLRKVTGDLQQSAGEIKDAADAFAAATKVIDRITKVIGVLSRAFA